jgi:hypothetical protein
LNKKVAAPVQKTEIKAVGISCANHVTPLYPQKLALTSPTGGSRSVGMVRSRTKATEFVCLFVCCVDGLSVAFILYKYLFFPPVYHPS